VEKQVGRLLAENAKLGKELEAARGDAERAERALGDARKELSGAQKELRRESRLRTKAEDARRSLQEERDTLTETLQLANKQLAGESMHPVLPPKAVAGLLGNLVAELDSQLGGMTVAAGEVQLKVGVQQIGEEPGFVLPSVERPLDPESVQAVSVRFQGGGDPSTEEASESSE